ncbi:hypothetical protein [Streptomyces cinnamoneus]|nr:hypothetical protein [Streptomyces cinnamoneus]
MTTASITPDPTPSASPLANALRVIKAFAGAAVSVALLGQYADERRA